MKILFVAAEVAPYVAVGGLSQVMRFLTRSLAKRGQDVRIFTPKYGVTDMKLLAKNKMKKQKRSWSLSVPTGAPEGAAEPASLDCNVLSFQADDRNAGIYFLENREYYELRANVFGYADDHVRFTLMARACLEWLLEIREARERGEKDAWWPDVIHCHDWHSSLFIEESRRNPRYRDALEGVAVVLTVHNFRYQGTRDFRYLPPEQKDDPERPVPGLFDKSLSTINALQRGLLRADAITTVSPTHAVEVLSSEYAFGLDDTLQAVRGKLSGILNGIDTDIFDPWKDPLIKAHFTKWRFTAARAINKKDLQKAFSLPDDPSAMVLGYVGRLDQQKGLDLMLEALPRLFELRDNVQLVVVGGGDDRFRQELENLKSAYPERVGLYLMSDFRLSRKVFAGADAILIPSHFEPGGIVALEALRYGAVPIVRRTGGLNDSIEEFDPAKGRGNGFSFKTKSGWSFFAVMIEAMTTWHQPPLWKRLIENCLSADFSWDHAAKEYEEWYERTISDRAKEHPASF